MRSVRALVLALAVGCSARYADEKKLAANASALAETLSEAVSTVDIPQQACTDIDSNGVATRSSLGGFCCKYCNEGRKNFICCPSHDYEYMGGENVPDAGADVSTKSPTQAHRPPRPSPPVPHLMRAAVAPLRGRPS